MSLLPRVLLMIMLPFLGAAGEPPLLVLEEVRAAAAPQRDGQQSPAEKPAGKTGWRVVDCADGRTHSSVFRLKEPLSARRLRLTFFFHSGQAGAFFRAFKMLATADASPAAGGRWTPLFPVWFGSREEGDLVRDTDGHGLRFLGNAAEPLFKMDYSLPFDRVTGLRLDVTATGPENAPRPAVLTDMHAQIFNTFSTNVALGCPVASSHPLAANMWAGFLTDGLRGTYARPATAGLGEKFFFEIDLKRHHNLDHLHLRTRGDALESNRLSQLHIQIYDRKPGPGVAPAWEGEHRPDGSIPDVSDEVVWPAAGKGVFAGRYLRISSESPAPFSPQIAEVEAYEALLPLGVTAMANEEAWTAGRVLKMPASSWLTFAIKHPNLPDPEGLGWRWRIAGFHDVWQAGSSTGVVEGRCPPPGEYEFQAQIRHSDDQWNTAMYRVPLIIPVPFWLRTSTRVAGGMLGVGLTTLLAWQVSRRVMKSRVAELERRNELFAERARIARDMHDAVGSQLTQLTVLHEIVAEELGLTPEGRAKLRHLTDTARASAAALDAVVWAVNPGNDTLANLASYLTQAAREYLVPLGIACRQDVPHEWPTHKVSSQTRHQLYLAFREALQNVVKHAQATEVVISLRHEGGRFFVSVADNGCGFQPAVARSAGKDGLRNMHTRLSSIDGRCDVHARPGGGTCVEMQIPTPSPAS